MSRLVLKIGIVCVLVGLGWIAGRAQATQPDFVISVNAEGPLAVKCVRGCNLAWVGNGTTPQGEPGKEFQFNCRSTPGTRCDSGGLGGWLTR